MTPVTASSGCQSIWPSASPHTSPTGSPRRNSPRAALLRIPPSRRARRMCSSASDMATMGLHLSPDKTLITHIDQGLDFLGWRIQRHRKRGSNRHYVYTYPAGKAVKAITGKIRAVCRSTDTNQPLDALLRQLNPALQGWCVYFRPGVSSRTFAYLSYYTWRQVGRWLRRKHRRSTWKELRRRY